MTYPETIAYLYERLPMFSRIGPAAFKKDLTNIRALCDALGNPQRKFKNIHVGGTNGKGSVCHMLAAVLQQAGYKTGLHTSPHLRDFRERLRIDGIPAPEDFVVDFVAGHAGLVERLQPSFFELSVAMAFQWFADNEVDVAVVEVGLGGRLDSTNILLPEVSVITNISLEHTQMLGDTRKAIAGEKAGIIKAQTPVVVGEVDPETAPVYVERAEAQQAPLVFAPEQFSARLLRGENGGQQIAVRDRSAGSEQVYALDLGGGYQQQNLLTVLSTVGVLRQKGWDLPQESVIEALSRVKQATGLRGRWEVLGHAPLVLADVAHNPAGLQQLMAHIGRLSFDRLWMVIGFVKDKNVAEALTVFPRSAAYFFCQADNPRSLPATTLEALARAGGLNGSIQANVPAALAAARAAAGPDDLIVVTGSTFVVAEIIPMRP